MKGKICVDLCLDLFFIERGLVSFLEILLLRVNTSESVNKVLLIASLHKVCFKCGNIFFRCFV